MDHVEYGKYLMQQRELRGLSREAVSRATKIPPTLIAALEDGQVERLPARVFVLAYIRAYAQVIGIEAEEAVLRYEEVDHTLPAPQLPPAALERERRRKAWRTLAGVALALAAAGAGYLAFAGRALLGH